MVVVVPVPVVVSPRLLISDQDPEEGSPLILILPVGARQVGCVAVPRAGAAGIPGGGLITAAADDNEVHDASETVKVYVPCVSPEIIVLVPVPVIVVPPGDLVSVHVPATGKPLKEILPMDTEQVGWVILLMSGAGGVSG